ncbi:MAG: lysostaphin resistance A-like protein [Candidatus Hodarchaeota archaeon]
MSTKLDETAVQQEKPIPEHDESSHSIRKKKNPIIQSRMQIGITLVFGILPNILFLIFRSALKFHFSKIYMPLLAFPLNLVIVGMLYPQKLKIPFGKTSAREFTTLLGISKHESIYKFILLGGLLGFCALSGLLIGSLLTGRYTFSIENLEIEQVIFSTVPGVWEEIYFRGILMFLLLKILKNLKKAVIVQTVIFAFFHIRSFELWALVDVFSVFLIALALTYTAFKTNSLIPCIVFHYIHDAFLFLFQVPNGDFFGIYENVVSFTCLWMMLGLGALITSILSKKWNIKDSTLLYDIGKVILPKNNATY